MPISVLMPKIIFIKYLLPAKPKLVPKLKIFRVYGNLIFEITDLDFNVKNDLFLWNVYHLFGPDQSQN